MDRQNVYKTKLKNIVIIPFGLPYDWPADYEKQTARELAQKTIVIMFRIHEGISLKTMLFRPTAVWSLVSKNLYSFRPVYILPYQRFPAIERINYFLSVIQLRLLIYLSKWRSYRLISWFFSLQRTVLPHHFGKTFSIYDCVDYFRSTKPQGDSAIEKFEQVLLSQVDTVFCDSEQLYSALRDRHKYIYVIPKGFDAQSFMKLHFRNPLRSIGQPIVGYVGNISTRIDFTFLFSLISSTPDFSYVFIGPIDKQYEDKRVDINVCIEKLKRYPNVILIDKVSKELISSYINQFTIGLIPYDTSYSFNRLSYPNKTMEYFYMGKPVVTTPIAELTKLYPYVSLVQNARDAKNMIKKLLSKPWPREYQKKQRTIALSNSWERKIEAIRKILKKEFGVSI